MPFPRSNSFRGTTSPSESPQKDVFPSSPGVSRQKTVTGGRKHKQNAENMPPNTPTGRGSNSVCPDSPVYCKSSTKTNKGNGSVTPLHASPGLPPRPPSASKVPKRKLQWEAQQAADTVPLAADVQSSEGASDTGVTVLVRVRPFNKKEVQEQSTALVSKASSNSLTICEQQYTFDAVAGEDSSQDDMFQIVGLPMVDNCLAGFNSSIFAYGQTGSGKTYTMWGVNHDPTSGKSPSEERGLTPRVFETLFAKIKEEEKKNADKQLYYQCRCSFLEIYNEQIADLLEPRHKNLQIREDVKTGVYVDNLTEEYVSNMDDVARLLLKGLGNRRVGATSMNAESSRSHTVFTCVLECRFKSVADGMSSVRRSRINLVDLAGSERQKQSGAAGERLKEAGNINRSLSQLGNVINILAEIAQTGKQRHVPYRDSRLTFLLQESLGGNAKLAMICAVSPADSCKSETTSTLRFAQRAKAIQNKAVINEETTTDSNILREQIRQLKDELKRMKSKEGQQVGGDGAYSSGWNARRSYNLLRLSLALPMTVPATEESDTDEEMEIDEDAVEDSGHATAMLAPTSPTMTELAPTSPRMTESSTAIVPFSLNSRRSLEVRSSLRSSKLSTMVTERIAASLQRGLQILDDHQQNSSDLRFSFKTQCEPQEEHSPEKMPTPESPELCLPQPDDVHSQEIEELKEALELAMTGHARLLEQYAELQEKHVALVAKHRRIREGVTDVRQMASKAGVGPSQLKWLESQAAQIVALNLEREQERQAANEEIEFLQAQLQDTAEAVQAAGELLVRLKEAEESVTIANDAAAIAEQEADRLYREMEKLKRRHATEMATLQQRLLESRLRRSAACPMCVMAERVKFQFTEVDPENAAAALEADQDAAALTEAEQQQDEPTSNMWDGVACEDEFAEASSLEAEDFEDGAQEIQDLYDGSDDRCNF